MTQTEAVMKYMTEFGSITTLEAFNELGVTRLASRIHDLRGFGVKISREVVKGKNRYGEPVHYMRYSIEEDKCPKENTTGSN